MACALLETNVNLFAIGRYIDLSDKLQSPSTVDVMGIINDNAQGYFMTTSIFIVVACGSVGPHFLQLKIQIDSNAQTCVLPRVAALYVLFPT